MAGLTTQQPFPLFIILHRQHESRHWTAHIRTYTNREKALKDAKTLEKVYKHTTVRQLTEPVRQIQELTPDIETSQSDSLEQPRE